MNTWAIFATALATVLTALGGGSIVTSLARRKPTRVEAIVNLNESTFEWAQRIEAARIGEREAFEADRRQLREDIREAREEARQARASSASVTALSLSLRGELEELQTKLAWMSEIIQAIREPDITVDRLRDMLDRHQPERRRP